VHKPNKGGDEMTIPNRKKLRKLQNEFLKHSNVKQFVRKHGEDHPLLEGFPTFSQLNINIFPEHADTIKRLLEVWA